MPKAGRTPIPFDWKMIELSIEAGSTEKEIAEEYGCDRRTIGRAIQKQYGMDFVTFATRRHSKGKRNLRIATYQKVRDGNVQVILHLRKFWFNECDYELERRIKEEHENKDVEAQRSCMFDIAESCKKLVEKDGPIAEPRPIELINKDGSVA